MIKKNHNRTNAYIGSFSTTDYRGWEMLDRTRKMLKYENIGRKEWGFRRVVLDVKFRLGKNNPFAYIYKSRGGLTRIKAYHAKSADLYLYEVYDRDLLSLNISKGYVCTFGTTDV